MNLYCAVLTQAFRIPFLLPCTVSSRTKSNFCDGAARGDYWVSWLLPNRRVCGALGSGNSEMQPRCKPFGSSICTLAVEPWRAQNYHYCAECIREGPSPSDDPAPVPPFT